MTPQSPDSVTLPALYRELRTHVDRLKTLLDDPHPAQWSWCTCVGIEAKAIAELYGGNA